MSLRPTCPEAEKCDELPPRHMRPSMTRTRKPKSYHIKKGWNASGFFSLNVSVGSILSKKSPKEGCRIGMGNIRIAKTEFLNTVCGVRAPAQIFRL
jgi:hypothetical protein